MSDVFDLPYGSGLSSCNPKGIEMLENEGDVLIDGGAAKWKEFDSEVYDYYKDAGLRPSEITKLLESDWIIAIDAKNKCLSFTYINPNPMGTGIAHTFLLNEFEIYVSNNIVKIAGSNVDKTYKIKVGRSAAKNIAYICKNQEQFLK